MERTFWGYFWTSLALNMERAFCEFWIPCWLLGGVQSASPIRLFQTQLSSSLLWVPGVHTSQSLDDGSYASISFVSFSPIVVLFLASCKE